jgi:uncharacterized SAM-binding protein YcdF (DUF218 family)
LSLARARESPRSDRVLTWPRTTLVTTVLIAVVAAAIILGVRGLGAWLVVEDPLAPARTVVALGGEVPFRAMEAAAIYRQGWTSEVWLTRSPQDAGEDALRQLGIQVTGEEVYNRAVLERLGVPVTAIRVLSRPAQNTAQEVQVIAEELQKTGGGQVILVTSKPHSRRVRATWRALIGETPHVIVRYATSDPYDADRWWRHTGDALAVSREVFGLLNVWAGFPVRPARAGL